MTKQEIFNRVWDHFVRKKNPLSYTKKDGINTIIACRYRQDHTAQCPVRCAIGLFLPDEAYKLTEHGTEQSLYQVLQLCPDLQDVLAEPNERGLSFLASLQDHHDHAARDKESAQHYQLERNLRIFADDNNLSIGVPTHENMEG